MKTLKNLYNKLLSMYDVSFITFKIKEWSELYRRDIFSRGSIFFLAPFVLISYLFLRMIQMIREKKLKKADYVYKLKNGSGVSFFIPRFDEDIMQRYYLLADDFHDHDILKPLCRKYIKKNAVICDIGGNIGNHSVYFAKFCDPKIIYTFEPVKDTFSILEKNVSINGFNLIIKTYNYALGSRETFASINTVDINNSGANRVIEDASGETQIKRLDSLQLGKIDFFKIDVEGFEYDVILGGRDTFAKSNATIFIEIFDENYKKVNELLTDIGYELVADELVEKRHDYIYRKS